VRVLALFEQVGRAPRREEGPVARHEAAVRRVLDWVQAGPRGLRYAALASAALDHRASPQGVLV
jgi:hypothetical protein